MLIKKREIGKGVFVVEFENQHALASTFLRFAEFFESPKFHGKIFSLEEYKKWYIGEKGTFSYYDDWPAFNIPGSVLKIFFEGKFNPLSEGEKQFLDLFRNQSGDYYIIGVFSGADQSHLEHEMAHALFYTEPEYKKQVISAMKKYELEKIRNELRGMSGYCEEVIEDELHAWIFTLSDELKEKPPEELKTELERIFKKFVRADT